MPYNHHENRRRKIPKARDRVENWRESEAALRDRGGLTVWMTPEAVAAWHPARIDRRDRFRHYSDIAIETGVMLHSVAGLPGLTIDVPDDTTISRRSAALSLVTALSNATGPTPFCRKSGFLHERPKGVGISRSAADEM